MSISPVMSQISSNRRIPSRNSVYSPPALKFPSMYPKTSEIFGKSHRNSISPISTMRTSTSFVLPRSSEDYMKILRNSSMEGWIYKRSLKHSNNVSNYFMRINLNLEKMLNKLIRSEMESKIRYYSRRKNMVFQENSFSNFHRNLTRRPYDL